MVVVPEPLPLWWVPPLPEVVPELLVEPPLELVGAVYAGAGAVYVGVGVTV